MERREFLKASGVGLVGAGLVRLPAIGEDGREGAITLTGGISISASAAQLGWKSPELFKQMLQVELDGMSRDFCRNMEDWEADGYPEDLRHHIKPAELPNGLEPFASTYGLSKKWRGRGFVPTFCMWGRDAGSYLIALPENDSAVAYGATIAVTGYISNNANWTLDVQKLREAIMQGPYHPLFRDRITGV